MVKNKKDFLGSLGILIKEHWEKYKKREKKYQNIHDQLNFKKKEEYDDLVYKENYSINFFYLILPFKIAFYLALFSFVFLVGLKIDLIHPFKVIIATILMVYPLFMILFFFELIFSSTRLEKRKKEVLDYLK